MANAFDFGDPLGRYRDPQTDPELLRRVAERYLAPEPVAAEPALADERPLYETGSPIDLGVRTAEDIAGQAGDYYRALGHLPRSLYRAGEDVGNFLSRAPKSEAKPSSDMRKVGTVVKSPTELQIASAGMTPPSPTLPSPTPSRGMNEPSDDIMAEIGRRSMETKPTSFAPRKTTPSGVPMYTNADLERVHNEGPSRGGFVQATEPAYTPDSLVEEAGKRAYIADPYGLRLREALAGIDVDKALGIKAGEADIEAQSQERILQKLSDFDTQVDREVNDNLKRLRARPDYQQLDPQSRQKKEEIIARAGSSAKDAQRQRLGLATGRVSTTFKGGSDPYGPG